MQPTANNLQRADPCWLHGHAKHAMQRLYLKCHAMQQLRAECAYMRVLFFGPNPLSAWFNRASATALKGSEGVCAGRTPPGAVAEQAMGPPRHHAPTPHVHRR